MFKWFRLLVIAVIYGIGQMLFVHVMPKLIRRI